MRPPPRASLSQGLQWQQREPRGSPGLALSQHGGVASETGWV